MFYIKKLNLNSFRCYRNYQIDFAPNINIIYGNNAVGKTSLVEAIHCLALVKSHKAITDDELIHKGATYTIIKALINNNENNDELILSIFDKKKKIQKNNKMYSSLSDYIGFFNVVIFSPEDLNLVKGAPLERRKFLDINLSQTNNQYLLSLIRYRKFLKQRNEILKNHTEKYDQTLLSVVTDSLIKEAKYIISERVKFLNQLNPYFQTITEKISINKERGELSYLPNCNADQVENNFRERLKTDLMLKTTTTGPHRDDFSFSINNTDAASYGSQGQQRTLTLALKLALAEVIKEKKQNIIIILDDVFSELDTNRQNQILNLLNQSNQIFITTTGIDNLSKDILNQSNIIKIQKEVEENEF